MLEFIPNFSLRKLNTFGVEVNARSYLPLSNIDDIHELIDSTDLQKNDFLILGEGSNILFTTDFNGIILHPLIKGIEIINETSEYADLKVAAGENWDNYVSYTVEAGFCGLENLSLIPGSVGSVPVQNIGAYGVEAKDTILWVEGIEIDSNHLRRISAEECNFSYRQSIFKQELKDKFIITDVVFRLRKQVNFNLSYGNIEPLFREKEVQDLRTLRQTIIEIRESKLPDPSKTGNAGSFFKNPLISSIRFSDLKKLYPEIPGYPSGNSVKVPAAWLIEKSGWKGKRLGNVGTWPLQPLVIVNYGGGGANGKEIFDFSMKIQEAVKEMFEIEMEREVNVIV